MATRKPPAASKIARTAKKKAKPARAKAVAKKSAAKKAPATKAIARKVVTKKVAARKAAPRKVVKKSAAKAATTARMPAAKKKSAAVPLARKKITTKQAMANTLALLKAKNEKSRRPPNYPTGDMAHPGAHGPHGVGAPQPETAPTERLTEAIHGHAYATETGDESKRGQS
jgi:hypothetical protein